VDSSVSEEIVDELMDSIQFPEGAWIFLSAAKSTPVAHTERISWSLYSKMH
jgi:hypothetical protein